MFMSGVDGRLGHDGWVCDTTSQCMGLVSTDLTDSPPKHWTVQQIGWQCNGFDGHSVSA
jgi:hypothetical protein